MSELADQTGFVPQCPDCRYDLSGLEDGNCPECGLRFRYEYLHEVWLERKRSLAARYKERFFDRRVSIIGAICLTLFGALFNSLVSWAFAMCMWGLIAWIFYSANRSVLKTQSYRWLLLVPPLEMLAFGVSGSRHALIPLVMVGVLICALAWMALRSSPLISSLILATCGPLPLLLIGASMVVHAVRVRARGEHWTDFDWPAEGRRWRPLLIDQLMDVSLLCLAVGGVLLAFLWAFFARSRTRLKHGVWD